MKLGFRIRPLFNPPFFVPLKLRVPFLSGLQLLRKTICDLTKRNLLRIAGLDGLQVQSVGCEFAVSRRYLAFCFLTGLEQRSNRKSFCISLFPPNKQ